VGGHDLIGDDGEAERGAAEVGELAERAASPIDIPFWATPITMPPTTLTASTSRPAIASPLTNFDAPSIAPWKSASRCSSWSA
jgi:hypothetical protein